MVWIAASISLGTLLGYVFAAVAIGKAEERAARRRKREVAAHADVHGTATTPRSADEVRRREEA